MSRYHTKDHNGKKSLLLSLVLRACHCISIHMYVYFKCLLFLCIAMHASKTKINLFHMYAYLSCISRLVLFYFPMHVFYVLDKFTACLESMILLFILLCPHIMFYSHFPYTHTSSRITEVMNIFLVLSTIFYVFPVTSR